MRERRVTATTIEERVSIVKRLREMLLRQREKFQGYLDLLELEGGAIERGDLNALQVQLEAEKLIIAEVHTLGKVIAPLEDLYRAAYPQSEESIPALKAVLDTMGARMKERNSRNRQVLKEKMESLRQEIAGLRSWQRPASPFAEVAPSLVDITT
jgi:flagellar biosynthesis/type III secretory pathway chaperone